MEDANRKLGPRAKIGSEAQSGVTLGLLVCYDSSTGDNDCCYRTTG